MAEKSQVTGGIGGALSGASAGAAFGPVGIGIGAALGGLSGFMGGGGENRALNLAQQQSDLYGLEGDQERRRLDFEKNQAVGRARGLSAASNLQDKYSPRTYTNRLESQYLSDLSFSRLSTSLKQRMAMNQGQAAASSIEMGGWNNLIGGAADATGAFGNQVMDLFKPAKSTLGGIDVSGWAAADRG